MSSPAVEATLARIAEAVKHHFATRRPETTQQRLDRWSREARELRAVEAGLEPTKIVNALAARLQSSGIDLSDNVAVGDEFLRIKECFDMPYRLIGKYWDAALERARDMRKLRV